MFPLIFLMDKTKQFIQNRIMIYLENSANANQPNRKVISSLHTHNRRPITVATFTHVYIVIVLFSHKCPTNLATRQSPQLFFKIS